MKITSKQLFFDKLREKYFSIIIGILVVFGGFFIFGKASISLAGGSDFEDNEFISSVLMRNKPDYVQSSSSGQIDMEAAATSQVKVTSDTYVVAPGDTLSIISIKVYGDMYMWQKIADANNITNVDNIEEGQVLKIPLK
jgi:nucleoid-associated protein YgaU